MGKLTKSLTDNLATKILWGVFASLLAVLLPHTAWLFGSFEANGVVGSASAWAAAFSFESAIAVLVHKLAKHWELTPKRLSGRARFLYRWANAYFVGLLITSLVSVLANLAHAVEFGGQLAIFAQWGIPPKIYQVAFGGILPMASLIFARVLSNDVSYEDDPDPILEEAKRAVAEMKEKLKEAAGIIVSLKMQLEESERKRQDAEARFNAAGELFRRMFEGEKRQRIIAIKQKFPQLGVSAIAILADTSPGYASDVLKETEVAAV